MNRLRRLFFLVRNVSIFDTLGAKYRFIMFPKKRRTFSEGRYATLQEYAAETQRLQAIQPEMERLAAQKLNRVVSLLPQ